MLLRKCVKMKRKKIWVTILLILLVVVALLFPRKGETLPPQGIELRGVKATHCTDTFSGVEQFGIRFDIRYRITSEFDHPLGTTYGFAVEFPEDLVPLIGTNGTAVSQLVYWGGDARIREDSTTVYFGSTQPENGVMNELFQPMHLIVHCYVDGERVYSQEVTTNL